MLLAGLFMIASCSGEKESSEQTFFVNVYYTYSDYESYGERVAETATVALFEDTGKEIDPERTSTFSLELYDTDGNALPMRYIKGTTGINTFENVQNGNYILFALYAPYTYVRYHSYKRITVNGDYNGNVEKIVFDCSQNSGFQPWQ